MSPKTESFLERLSYQAVIASLGEENHLKDKEELYVNTGLHSHGIFIIRENEDGWWKEKLDFKKDMSKQLSQLKADPNIIYGWVIDSRFNEKGGWGE